MSREEERKLEISLSRTFSRMEKMLDNSVEDITNFYKVVRRYCDLHLKYYELTHKNYKPKSSGIEDPSDGFSNDLENQH